MKSVRREEIIRMQFDSFCKKVIKNYAVDIHRALERQYEKEKSTDSLSAEEELELAQFSIVSSAVFSVFGFQITVSNPIMATALEALSEKNRTIILAYYFLDMNDKEIAKQYQAARNTIQERRTRAMMKLKNLMEEYKDE